MAAASLELRDEMNVCRDSFLAAQSGIKYIYTLLSPNSYFSAFFSSFSSTTTYGDMMKQRDRKTCRQTELGTEAEAAKQKERQGERMRVEEIEKVGEIGRGKEGDGDKERETEGERQRNKKISRDRDRMERERERDS